MLCLIDTSTQFYNTGNKYEVAIECVFGRRLRMSTISAVPTMYLYGKYACACNSAQVYGLKVLNFVFGK